MLSGPPSGSRLVQVSLGHEWSTGERLSGVGVGAVQGATLMQLHRLLCVSQSPAVVLGLK